MIVLFVIVMQARKKGVTLLVPELHSDMYELLVNTGIEVDIHRMAEVIRNLVSNALKFTPHGGTVKIFAQHVVDVCAADGYAGRADASIAPYKHRRMLRLQFVDSGAGISQVRRSGCCSCGTCS